MRVIRAISCTISGVLHELYDPNFDRFVFLFSLGSNATSKMSLFPGLLANGLMTRDQGHKIIPL